MRTPHAASNYVYGAMGRSSDIPELVFARAKLPSTFDACETEIHYFTPHWLAGALTSALPITSSALPATSSALPATSSTLQTTPPAVLSPEQSLVAVDDPSEVIILYTESNVADANQLTQDVLENPLFTPHGLISTKKIGYPVYLYVLPMSIEW